MTNVAQQYLKYAHVQMAAEAFIIDPKTGDERFSGGKLVSALEDGNGHTSIFTPTLATEWDVIDHQANTNTGFSGTLFKHKSIGEFVLSFRSTEFIDDQVNDSAVTNKGIKGSGWAIGQISDMWDGGTSKIKFLVGVAAATLNGYSSGAHPAYAWGAVSGDAAACYW